MKNRMINVATMLLLMSGFHSAAWGQRKSTLPSSKDTLTEQLVQSSRKQVDAAIYFRIGESHIDPIFEGNNIRLGLFLTKLQQVLSDSNYVVNQIKVVGTASPDGVRQRNLQLANERANSLATYIKKQVSIDTLQIEVINGGENWAGLRAMIEHSNMPYKDDMLRLMDKHPENPKERKLAMQYYADSKPWLWMYDHFFSALRKGRSGVQLRKDSLISEQLLNTETVPMMGSGISFCYDSVHHKQQHDSAATEHRIKQDADSIATADLSEIERQPIRTAKGLHPMFAIKTNLTQWAGLTPDFSIATFMPNLEVELCFARRWSIEAGALYTSHDAFSGNKFYAVSSFHLEPRVWLRADGLFRGFYAGVCGRYGDFNYQANKDGGTDNATGTFWSSGVSLGFVQPFGRRWALELGLTGSYRNATFNRYSIEYDNSGALHHYLDSADTEGKFVPGVRVNVQFRFGK